MNEEKDHRFHFKVVKPLADKVCVRALDGKPFKAGMLCATEAADQGNRGGGLVVHRVLVGVLSCHNDFNKPGRPNVYARVGKFVKWIRENFE